MAELGRLAAVARESAGADGTVKLLLALPDGLRVECVLIPHERLGRTTLCLSSQVGCARACPFCATGRAGFFRDLTSEEILAQAAAGLAAVRRSALPPLRNAVFMGMGEPMDNAAAVRRAVEGLVDPRRFGLAKRKVMVSTMGPSPEAFAELGAMDAVIAWSLHAAEDGLRRRLVPSATHGTAALRSALAAALSRRRPAMQVLMIETTLIDGVNDSVAHADALAAFLEPLAATAPKICVDLIPMNAIGGESAWRPSPRERVLRFQRRLRERGVFCSVRIARGIDAGAACGQLAAAMERKPT